LSPSSFPSLNPSFHPPHLSLRLRSSSVRSPSPMVVSVSYAHGPGLLPILSSRFALPSRMLARDSPSIAISFLSSYTTP
jgi:hypothetical protein